jgi:hypothetical protein
MHTCRSDGKEDPATVTANYRGHGYDFLAITDHWRYYPSLEAMQTWKDLSDFNLIPGEEVHLPLTKVHYVNIGGSYSVNALVKPSLNDDRHGDGIEYRSLDGTSYFELAMDLINAINALASSRVDDVQQAVDYILLLRDIACDTDEEINAITKAVAKGILAFRSIQNASVQPSVEVLNTRINQSEVQTLQDFLCKKVEEALHIPNRETRGSSGDTGTAVENRAGYRSLENIAGLITLQARRAETKALDTILQICKAQNGCPFASLTVNDIEIKANRNKVENLTTASNAYSTLRSAGLNDIDALNACELVPDSIGTATRNKAEAEENQQRQLELAQQTAKLQESKTDSNEKKSEKTDDK